MSKFNLTLCGLALAQALVLLVIHLTGEEAASRPDAVELLESHKREVARVVISNAADDEEVILAKKADDSWVVASADDYPVRKGLVLHVHEEGETDHSDGLLDKLAKIEVRRPVIRQKKNHAPYKVGDKTYERRITLEDEAGKVLDTLYVARGTRGTGSFVRRGGEDEVYETEDIKSWDLSSTTSAWVTVSYVDLAQDDVASFEVALAEGDQTLAFERRDETKPVEKKDGEDPPKPGEENPEEPKTETVSTWWITKPEAKKAKKSKVDDILRKVCKISLADVSGRKKPEAGGFDKPSAVYRIKMKDGKEHVVEIGGKNDDNQYYVKSSGSEFFVLASSWAVSSAVEVKIDELAEEPPKVDEPKPGEEAPKDPAPKESDK